MSRFCMRVLAVLAVFSFLVVGQVQAAPHPNCNQVICFEDCPYCPGMQTVHVDKTFCINDLQEWRCHWSCGHVSTWDQCWCYNCNCSPGGGGCFLAGTLIEMADGSRRPIDVLEQGDQIMAYDRSAGLMKVTSVAVGPQSHLVDSYLTINGTIRVTGEHPMLSNGRWVKAGDLVVGDCLTSANGSPVPISSIREVNQRAMVYNFQAGASGSYVAQGVVVHNKEYYTYYPCLGCEE